MMSKKVPKIKVISPYLTFDLNFDPSPIVTVLELAIYKTNVLNKTTTSLIYRGFL